MAAKPKLKVTWVKSTIGHKAAARGTIRALGLRRLHQSVEVADTPEMRGMLRRVAFLDRGQRDRRERHRADGGTTK